MGWIFYLPDLPEDFFGTDAAFFVFGEAADVFVPAGTAALTGSAVSAGASFGW